MDHILDVDVIFFVALVFIFVLTIIVGAVFCLSKINHSGKLYVIPRTHIDSVRSPLPQLFARQCSWLPKS